MVGCCRARPLLPLRCPEWLPGPCCRRAALSGCPAPAAAALP
jgi:hypothetical protein